MSTVARDKTLRGLCPQRTWDESGIPTLIPFYSANGCNIHSLNSNDIVEQSNTNALASSMSSPLQPQNPTNWPRDVRYIDSTYYHTSVLPAIKQQMQALPSTTTTSNSKRPKVVIRRISNQSHPTYGQLGLFAGQRIAAKSQIIDYIGKISMNTLI